MSYTPTNADVARHAARIVGALDDAVRADLADAALVAIELHFDMRVDIVDAFSSQGGGDGFCSVRGRYYPKDLRIEIIGSSNERGMGFTALHELGHHLIRHDVEINDAKFDLDSDVGHHFIERAADKVAAALLMPDNSIGGVFDGGVTAASVMELFARTGGSRSACCTRATDFMKGAGAVMLARSGVAVYTAHYGTDWAIARNTRQPTGSIINRAPSRGLSPVRFATGTEKPDLLADAVVLDGDWVVAVFYEHTAPWASFSGGRRKWGSSDDFECAICDVMFTPYYGRCDHCRYPFCEEGHCRCTVAVSKVMCKICFVYKPAEQVSTESGFCSDCVD